MTLPASRVRRSTSSGAFSRPSRRVRTACAWLLVLLVALPFTAPFSTCNLTMLIGDTHAALQVARPLSMTTAIEARSDTAGSVLDEESFHHVAIAAPLVDLFVVSITPSAPAPMPRAIGARMLIALRL